jgi:hypothetical protein
MFEGWVRGGKASKEMAWDGVGRKGGKGNADHVSVKHTKSFGGRSLRIIK